MAWILERMTGALGVMGMMDSGLSMNEKAVWEGLLIFVSTKFRGASKSELL